MSMPPPTLSAPSLSGPPTLSTSSTPPPPPPYYTYVEKGPNMKMEWGYSKERQQRDPKINPKIFEVANAIFSDLSQSNTKKDIFPLIKDRLYNLQKLLIERAAPRNEDGVDEINSIIVDVRRIQAQMDRVSEMDPNGSDHQLNQIGLNIRIDDVTSKTLQLITQLFTKRTMFTHQSVSDLVKDSSKIPSPEALQKTKEDQRQEAASKLAASENDIMRLCLKLDSEALKKLIISNQLDLSLLPLANSSDGEQSASRNTIHFTTRILMHFCSAETLTAEHFNVLTTLIDAGCDFDEVFSTTLILRLFGAKSGLKMKEDTDISAIVPRDEERSTYIETFLKQFSKKPLSDESAALLIRFLHAKIRPEGERIGIGGYDYSDIPRETMQACLDCELIAGPFAPLKNRLENVFNLPREVDHICLNIASGAYDYILFGQDLSSREGFIENIHQEIEGADREKIMKAIELRENFKAKHKTKESTDKFRKEFETEVHANFSAISLNHARDPHANFSSNILSIITDYVPRVENIASDVWREIHTPSNAAATTAASAVSTKK